jgi:excisionase family DNA binding protein
MSDALSRERQPKRDRTADMQRALRRKARDRDRRQAALNDPQSADVRPVAVSIADFSLMTGLSHATIYRRIADNTLRSVKLANRRLISFEEVERLRGGE